MLPKCQTDEETPAASLDEGDLSTSPLIVPVVFPGPVDGLEAQETTLHLCNKDNQRLGENIFKNLQNVQKFKEFTRRKFFLQ